VYSWEGECCLSRSVHCTAGKEIAGSVEVDSWAGKENDVSIELYSWEGECCLCRETAWKENDVSVERQLGRRMMSH
jgi:hypothetical protein